MLRRGPVVEYDTVDSDSESKAAATKSVVPAKATGTPQEHFEMSDLIEVGLLGSGSFGRVTLVRLGACSWQRRGHCVRHHPWRPQLMPCVCGGAGNR